MAGFKSSRQAGETSTLSPSIGATVGFAFWSGKRDDFKLVAQRSSPLAFQEFLVVERFVRYAILIPTFLLALIAWIIQRTDGRREFHFGHQRIVLASVFRRGTARMIDFSIPVAALVSSVVLHPDAVGWWFEVKSKWSLIDIYFHSGPTPSPKSLSWPISPSAHAKTCTGRLLSVPWHPLLAGIAFLFFVFQTIWQGTTGQTLGKWLLGVKVLQNNTQAMRNRSIHAAARDPLGRRQH